jgi:hypothetical protein
MSNMSRRPARSPLMTALLVLAVVAAMAMVFLVITKAGQGDEPRSVPATPGDRAASGTDATTTTMPPVQIEVQEVAESLGITPESLEKGSGMPTSAGPEANPYATSGGAVPDAAAVVPAGDCKVASDNLMLLLIPSLTDKDGTAKVDAALKEAGRWCDPEVMAGLEQTVASWKQTKNSDASNPTAADEAPPPPAGAPTIDVDATLKDAGK